MPTKPQNQLSETWESAMYDHALPFVANSAGFLSCCLGDCVATVGDTMRSQLTRRGISLFLSMNRKGLDDGLKTVPTQNVAQHTVQ